MAMNKRKKTTAVVAGITALALLLGGTFAWTSISQQAKNESAGIVNVGGRLHDDFNGTNKDVYVENFTDPLDGGQPIYARVKLTEYMEVGSEAGQADVADRNAAPVVEGTDINDVNTWTAHVPETDCAICETSGTCRIHDHWEWQMGGATVFMPTFNKDKDSLEADINGTYAGTDATDKIYYDDYVEYTAGDTLEGTEYYDDDTDTEDNNGTRQVANVTHTAKNTADGTVITMQDWIDAGSQPGNFWVYDEDGWAYWANPIMPGEATGLLLSNIEMIKNPGEKCYYAINVVGQFATVNDWEYFHNDEGEFDGTTNAMSLLEIASKNVATVVVTNESGSTLLTPGEDYTFNANVYVDGVAKYAASDFEWSVLDSNNNVSKNSTIADGVLSVGASETNKNLIVVAKAKDANYLGALGMTSVSVDVKDFKIAVKAVADEYGYIDNLSTDSSLNDGETVELLLNNGDETVTEGVTWSMELIDGGQDDTNTTLQDGTGIDENTGVLTIASDETTWQSNGYSKETYHVIRVKAAVDGTELASRKFVISGSGVSVSTFDFYEVGGSDMVSPYTLVVGKTYDVRGTLFNQSLYTDISNIITASMDPIFLDGLTFRIEDGDGNSVSGAVVENGQFTATDAGEYNIFAEGYLENWGDVSLYNYGVTVVSDTEPVPSP